MENIDICEANGLISGFRYHDAILRGITIEEKKCEIEILLPDGERVLVEFQNVFCVSLKKYYPGTIILSCFVWLLDEVPRSISGNQFYSECSEDGPITSKYVFFLDSSFGASMLILFDSFKFTVNGRISEFAPK